jgi:uncharacterized protein
LLLVGLTPIDANVTNSVSLTFLSVGSIIGSERDRLPQKNVLRKIALATFIGGMIGAVLLLITPSTTLKTIIPFLLILSSAAILIPRTTRSENQGPGNTIFFVAAAGIIGIYCGYFGAASGSMTIALVIQMLGVQISIAHAIKNVLLGIANGVAAIFFIFSGHVHWLPTIPLAIGFFIGGRTGPIIVRRANQNAIKVIVALSGTCVALWLLVRS